ncbi:MAG: hypothetical protein CR975_02085 [Gammaproteobacteria bacterium]|nr:MAG: hypothetical protein CR975_02085 [Gammaproteobacteria bacterium]
MPRELPTDNARRAENMWQYATVIDLDCGQRPPAVKVVLDDNDDSEAERQTTDWIPFAQPRAGKGYIWMPPQVGEQGIVLSSGGEMETLLFVCGVFADEFLPENPSADLTEIRFPNDDFFSHDKGDLTINCTGNITIQSGANFTVSASGTASINGSKVLLN